MNTVKLENNNKNSRDGNIPITNEKSKILVKSLKIPMLIPFLFSAITNLDLTIIFVFFLFSMIGTCSCISSKIPRLMDAGFRCFQLSKNDFMVIFSINISEIFIFKLQVFLHSGRLLN